MAQYALTTMLIDPYTALHAYSPILPVKELDLPPWTVQQAFKRMTAFFRMGPSLLTTDVRNEYDVSRPLDPDSWATVDDPEQGEGAELPAIRMPVSGKKGLWRWLQPYDTAGDNDARVTRFNEYGVDEEDTKIRKDRAPYTLVEGYLQLARPLLEGEILNSGA